MSEAPHPALPAFETLAARVDGAVLHLTFNRPEARNAMSLSMVTELRQALAWAEASQAIRVVVLRGAGGHFCAGGDIKDMAAARARPAAAGEDAIASLSAQFGELCAAFAHSPLAVVAVLEGTVMGGGFGLACVADIAIAGENVAFRLPEVTLGLVPAQIAPYLALRIGASQARRLAISGARVGAAQAFAIGLVHGVHAEAALDAALATVLHDLLQCAPQAVAQTKRLIDSARFTPAADLIAEAAATFARAVRGPEGAEGTAAFVQKRKPAWAAETTIATGSPTQRS